MHKLFDQKKAIVRVLITVLSLKISAHHTMNDSQATKIREKLCAIEIDGVLHSAIALQYTFCFLQ